MDRQIVCLAIPSFEVALARLNIPGLMLYGGSIKPGHFKGAEVTIQTG